MLDMVRPYKVTRIHRRFGLLPTETAWEARLLFSDVYFAGCSKDSFRRSFARKALLTVLKDSAPFGTPKKLRWEQIRLDVSYDRVTTTR